VSGGARAASSSGAAFTAAAQRRHPKGQRRTRWTPLSPSPRSEGPGGVQIRRYATWLVNPQMRRGAACGRRCARWPGANTNTAKRIHLRYAARSEGPGGATVGGVAHRGVANPQASSISQVHGNVHSHTVVVCGSLRPHCGPPHGQGSWRGDPWQYQQHRPKASPVPALFTHLLGVSGAPTGTVGGTAVGRRSMRISSFGTPFRVAHAVLRRRHWHHHPLTAGMRGMRAPWHAPSLERCW